MFECDVEGCRNPAVASALTASGKPALVCREHEGTIVPDIPEPLRIKVFEWRTGDTYECKVVGGIELVGYPYESDVPEDEWFKTTVEFPDGDGIGGALYNEDELRWETCDG